MRLYNASVNTNKCGCGGRAGACVVLGGPAPVGSQDLKEKYLTAHAGRFHGGHNNNVKKHNHMKHEKNWPGMSLGYRVHPIGKRNR